MPQRKRKPRRELNGAVFNELLIHYIQSVDEKEARKEAQQAKSCGMTRQRLNRAHKMLKVVTAEFLVLWSNGKPKKASEVMQMIEDYMEAGGSIKRAKKCQGGLP